MFASAMGPWIGRCNLCRSEIAVPIKNLKAIGKGEAVAICVYCHDIKFSWSPGKELHGLWRVAHLN